LVKKIRALPKKSASYNEQNTCMYSVKNSTTKFIQITHFVNATIKLRVMSKETIMEKKSLHIGCFCIECLTYVQSQRYVQ